MLPEKIKKLKEILYNTLILDHTQGADQNTITQNLSVSMTNAVKKNGINIFQIQSVVQNKIIVNIVNALKVVDEIQEEMIENVTPIDSTYLLDRKIKQLEEHIKKTDLSLKDFIHKARKIYIEYALDNHKTKTAAAKRLEIQRTYIPKVLKEDKDANTIT